METVGQFVTYSLDELRGMRLGKRMVDLHGFTFERVKETIEVEDKAAGKKVDMHVEWRVCPDGGKPGSTEAGAYKCIWLTQRRWKPE